MAHRGYHRSQFIQPWTIATQTRGGGSMSAGKRMQLLKEQRGQDTAQNAARQAAMDRQKAQQAALFKKAQDRLSQLGKTGEQRVREGGEKFEARGIQSLVSRGLHGTTVLDAFQRGVRSDTERGVTDVQERVAGRSADLFSREAGLQIPEGQFQLGGINMMSGGLEDYIRLLSMLGGGLS